MGSRGKSVICGINSRNKQHSLELSLERGQWLQRRDGQRKGIPDSRNGHREGAITDGRSEGRSSFNGSAATVVHGRTIVTPQTPPYAVVTTAIRFRFDGRIGRSRIAVERPSDCVELESNRRCNHHFMVSFYPRDVLHSAVFAVVLCLSVCPSVTRQYCV